MSMEVSNYIVSKLGYNLLKGLRTYLYRGYNPVTKYHGHPSIVYMIYSINHLGACLNPGPQWENKKHH